MRNYRTQRQQPPDEPLTIDADVISAYLERMNKPSMASFVRHLSNCDQQTNLKEMRLRDRIRELEAKYEPPADREKPFDPTPPPEASD